MRDPAESPPSFPLTDPAAAQRIVEDVEGWLTDGQVALLHESARAVPDTGRIVEIGSFRGRSTIVLAASAPTSAQFVAIDPHAGNDRGPQELSGYEAEAADDNAVFESNLRDAGVRERVRHVRASSDDAVDEVTGEIDLLFIDGAHRFGPARADIRTWGARVVPGGRMLIHDSFASVGVTLAQVTELFTSTAWSYEGRSSSLTCYRRVDLDTRGRVRSLLRQVAELPWFARNVVVKALILAKLGRLTRYLGHPDPDVWPH
ncbi:MAG: class I SAM-dependent methyltransferase [Acidimicrobiales bacterium]|nr:class I SAM-dependent methyltransferase [Acidimicrobiales bacterium]